MTDFRDVKLGEVATFRYGKMPDLGRLSTKSDGNYPVYSGYRIVGYYPEYLYEDKMLIVVCRGVGGTGNVKLSPPKCWLTNLSIAFHFTDKDVLKEYLYYLFQAYSLRFLDTGSAQSQITISDLKNLRIRLPGIRTQRRVAAILSGIDQLIENNDRHILLLEKFADELYREWFVRRRFPGHESVPVIKAVPEGWKMIKVGQAFEYTGGGTPSKAVDRYWQHGNINWFTPSDITSADGIFLEQSGEQCTDEGYNNSSAKLFPPYSVMLTSRATIGAIGINTTPACTNQGFITCIPNERYPLPYLYHWLKLAKPHFELLAGGATFAELTKGTFKNIEILTPTKGVMTQFEHIESPLFKTIETLLVANRKLVETRDLLLPRLISGKLSVKNLDIQFPPGMIEALDQTSDPIHHA